MIQDIQYSGRKLFVDDWGSQKLQWTGERGETEVDVCDPDGAGYVIMDAPITSMESVTAGLLIHTTQRDWLLTGEAPRDYRLWQGGPFSDGMA